MRLCRVHPRFSRPTWAKPWAAWSDSRAGPAWGRGWTRDLLKPFQTRLNLLIKPTQHVTSQAGPRMQNSVKDSGQKTCEPPTFRGAGSPRHGGISPYLSLLKVQHHTDCSCSPQSVEELGTTRAWTAPCVSSPCLKTGQIPLWQSRSFSKTTSSSLCNRLGVEVQQGKIARDFRNGAWALSQVLLLVFFFCSGEVQTNSKNEFCWLILLTKPPHFLNDNQGGKQ